MKSKHEFFRKGTANGGKPNIVIEIRRDEWQSVKNWSNHEVKESLTYLKMVRERLNSVIIEFEDLDNAYEELL
jgi:hypothetical protein